MTQGGGKQVASRNKSKGKNETATVAKNNQQQSASTTSTNRKSGLEKQKPTASVPSVAKADSDVETTTPTPSTNQGSKPPVLQEPIEICQLLPTGENRYTASDNWWKQALNKQQAFSVTDIGDWPERDQEEQYIVNVQRIVPVKPANNNVKTALTEKDINVNGNDHVHSYKSPQDDQVDFIPRQKKEKRMN